MPRRAGCWAVPVVAGFIVGVSLLAGFIAGTLSWRAHVYVISTVLGPDLDFWDAPADECTGVDRVVAAVNAARKAGRSPDLSVVDRLPGHRVIRSGTQVQLLSVRTISCAGLRERFAHIRVIDARSPLFSHEGYVTEARITQT